MRGHRQAVVAQKILTDLVQLVRELNECTHKKKALSFSKYFLLRIGCETDVFQAPPL